MAPPRAQQAGFTLIELLITLAITMIALSGLLSLNVTLARGNALAAQNAEAIAIIHGRMEQLRNSQVDCAVASTNEILVQGRNTSFVQRTIITPMTMFAGDTTMCRVRVEAAWLENRDKLPDNGDVALILGESAAVNFHSIALEAFRSSLEGS